MWRKTRLQAHLETYKRARDKLCKCIQEAKARYEEERIKACGNDQKSLFSIVKSLQLKLTLNVPSKQKS